MSSLHQIYSLQRTSGVQMQHVPSRTQTIAVPRAVAFPRRQQAAVFAVKVHATRVVSLVARAGPMGEQFEANNKEYAELTKAIEVREEIIVLLR